MKIIQTNPYTITQKEIAELLKMQESHLAYYMHRLVNELEFVNRTKKGVITVLELTDTGNKFLDQYEYLLELHEGQEGLTVNNSVSRLENIQCKAVIIALPVKPLDNSNWKHIAMNHWSQYVSTVQGVRVRVLLDTKKPIVLFIPPAVDGCDPDELKQKALRICQKVAVQIEQELIMKIGTPELSSKAEWVIPHPMARELSKRHGQIEVKGIAKINASSPRKAGEIEFYNLQDGVDFATMPRRLRNIEQVVEEIRAKLSLDDAPDAGQKVAKEDYCCYQ